MANLQPNDSAAEPIFSQFARWRGRAPAGFDVNFVGQLTDVSFNAGWADAVRMSDRDYWPPYAEICEEIFEWECLLSAVLEARDLFTMVEVGAGYGRWLVAAACALRRHKADLPIKLIGIEPEPQHFAWMQKHFSDNGLDPTKHRLIKAAAAGKDGEILFISTLDPAVSYGQHVVDKSDDLYDHYRDGKLIPCLSVETLLADLTNVDLLDMDIQGAELQAIPAGMRAMTQKVRRAYIGTHSRQIDEAMTHAFLSHGWQSVCQYGWNSEAETKFGKIKFEDGVQWWINPNV
jgi:FkbM family methyltransferase